MRSFLNVQCIKRHTHTHNTLGLLSLIPSHTPLAKSVVPMYFTTPKSNTFIPVSSVTLWREEREGGGGE